MESLLSTSLPDFFDLSTCTMETEAPAGPENLPLGDEMQRLDPAVRWVWTITFGLVAAGACGLAFVYEMLNLFAADRWLPFGVLTGGLALAGGLLSFGWARLRYRYWRYALREEELHAHHGVLNRVRTIVPLRRIQHLDVSQNVVEREFDLGTLVVHTAGTRSSDVAVPGLAMPTAEHLRDTIREHVLRETS